jgi:hypothetical protein
MAIVWRECEHEDVDKLVLYDLEEINSLENYS